MTEVIMLLPDYMETIWGPRSEWNKGKRGVYRLLSSQDDELIGAFDPYDNTHVWFVEPGELKQAFDSIDFVPRFHWRYGIDTGKKGQLWVKIELTTAGQLALEQLQTRIANIKEEKQ
jgi:hypothetical protein